MIKSVTVLVTLVLVVHFAHATRNNNVPTVSELENARNNLRPTSCKSVGAQVTRCVNSRSNDCCSRECNANSQCKCSGLGERCANDADCCARSIGANTIAVPCKRRICTVEEGGQ